MTNTKQFTASPENKSKARKYRGIAIIVWFLAMVGQVVAILKLLHKDQLTWLLVAIGLDHFSNDRFSKKSIKSLILDEFDKSLEDGFELEMKEIINRRF